MYKLFKALHYTNYYCIVEDCIGLNSYNKYVCIYRSILTTNITILIEDKIWSKGGIDSIYKNYYSDSCSYDELLYLIDKIVKSPNAFTSEILESLNSILINWDTV